MGIFRRRPLQRNPADGREYEEMHLPNPCYGQRYSVFWTGKTLDYEATEVHRVNFTDGSWANTHTGELHNAGPGELAVSRVATGGRPW